MKLLLEKMLPGCWCLLRWEKNLVSLGGNLEMLKTCFVPVVGACFLCAPVSWESFRWMDFGDFSVIHLDSKSSSGLCPLWKCFQQNHTLLSCLVTLLCLFGVIHELMNQWSINLMNSFHWTHLFDVFQVHVKELQVGTSRLIFSGKGLFPVEFRNW